MSARERALHIQHISEVSVWGLAVLFASLLINIGGFYMAGMGMTA